MPLSSMRDFVAPLVTSQEWNCYMKLGWIPRGGLTNTRFTFFLPDRGNVKAGSRSSI